MVLLFFTRDSLEILIILLLLSLLFEEREVSMDEAIENCIKALWNWECYLIPCEFVIYLYFKILKYFKN